MDSCREVLAGRLHTAGRVSTVGEPSRRGVDRPRPFSAVIGRLVFGTLVGLAAWPIDAVRAQSTPQRLSVADQQAALRLESLPTAEAARQGVAQAKANVERMLQRTSPGNAQRWRSFLRWEELETLLAAEEPDSERARQLSLRLRQNYPGLELGPMMQLRQRLLEWSQAIQYGRDPERTIEILKRRIEQADQRMEQVPEGADLERQREIGLTLAYLTETNQASPLVQAIHRDFAESNVRAVVSESFLHRRLSRSVDEPNPVDEVILGTRMIGDSWVRGQVTPRLVPHPSEARVCLQLVADFTSRSVGHNRSVRVLTTGHSPVLAEQLLALRSDGLEQITSPGVQVQLSSQLLGIYHPRKFVQRLASRAAEKRQPESNAIAQERLRNRLVKQFNEQVGERLAETAQNLGRQRLSVFDRLGLTAPVRSSWTSREQLSLNWRVGGPAQLLAPTPPKLTADSSGLSVQVHQTALINLIDPVLGGRQIESYQLGQFAKQFGPVELEGLQAEADGEPWSVWMAPFHPFEVAFDDNRIEFQIRTLRLERGDQILDDPATINAVYQPVLIDGELQLRRDGDLQVRFQRPRGGVRASTLRNFLAKKFEGIFKEELLDKPFSLAGVIPDAPADLKITDVSTAGGWLQLSVR
jgi:hypothetical protein